MTVAYVPGSFELPFVAKKLAESGSYDALICLGCIIRGHTPHFEYVASEAAKGIAHVGLATGVLVLGQRQTALVAKQAAEVDVLSGGRLRLGIGIGWNDVEYEALAMDFRNRGARSEEQVELLRALWTRPVVDFDGR